MLGHVAGNSGKRKVAKGLPKVCKNHGPMKATEKNPGNALSQGCVSNNIPMVPVGKQGGQRLV